MIIVKIIFSNATWHKQALGRKVEGEEEQRKVEVLPRRTIFSCFNIIYDDDAKGKGQNLKYRKTLLYWRKNKGGINCGITTPTTS